MVAYNTAFCMFAALFNRTRSNYEKTDPLHPQHFFFDESLCAGSKDQLQIVDDRFLQPGKFLRYHQ